MNLSQLIKSLVATSIVLALGAPVIASADNEGEIQGKSVKVSYADLDLQKSEGAKALYQRLQKASQQACKMSTLSDEGSVRRMVEAKKCYRIALAAAVDQVDSELLTQIHNN